ncbi:stress response membrane protein YncL [Trabulsiella odontotermitis]|nr:stress response membrane protein YncL [Trabulsiella odontotermitis]
MDVSSKTVVIINVMAALLLVSLLCYRFNWVF